MGNPIIFWPVPSGVPKGAVALPSMTLKDAIVKS